jgi:hypothetical protein
MKDEIQALRSNDTWSLVPFHPLMYAVGSYWVYKIKHCANGSIELIRLSWLLQALLYTKILIILRLLVLLLSKLLFG